MTADLRVARRIDALFRALSTDFLLREQFVTDPAQIMAEYVTGSSLAEDAADLSNQMLYAVVSNGSLFRWLVRYAGQHDGQPPTRSAFATDFADAVATYGDRQVVGALIRSAGKPQDYFEPASNLLLALISVLGPAQVREGARPQDGQTGVQGTGNGNGKNTVGVFAARASAVPSPAGMRVAATESRPRITEISPRVTEFTEISPGFTEITAITEISPGVTEFTEISPGVTEFTEISPGVTEFTEISPGVTEFTEISPGVTEFTEISPGVTEFTEISPGVTEFTEISPGVTEFTEISPGVTEFTEISPGVTEFTEISPGVTEFTEISPGVTEFTEISPGVTEFTEISPGVTEFTEISPGVTEFTEISPGGTEFTEISPGITDVTEVSPGVTDITEISPGGGVTGIIEEAYGPAGRNGGGAQIVFPRHLQATMTSLIEFARELRAAGDLDLTATE